VTPVLFGRFIGRGNRSSLKKNTDLPQVTDKLYHIEITTDLFEGLLFKESILSGQIRESEAIIKMLNFLA
jgi:hypothetical protein